MILKFFINVFSNVWSVDPRLGSSSPQHSGEVRRAAVSSYFTIFHASYSSHPKCFVARCTNKVVLLPQMTNKEVVPSVQVYGRKVSRRPAHTCLVLPAAGGDCLTVAFIYVHCGPRYAHIPVVAPPREPR